MAELSIAVDGPGSAGKGTVARGVARLLGYQYIDTGAMYRAVALLAERRGVSWDDADELTKLARSLRFRFTWDGDVLRLSVDDEDVSAAIRADAVGVGASRVSVHEPVREALVELQRGLASDGGVVMDGRDIGTVVLARADLKIYLDASLEERARRRHDELMRRGGTASFTEVYDTLAARDHRDMNRSSSPLRRAADAVLVDSTDLTIRQAIRQVIQLAVDRGARPPAELDMGARAH